MWQIFQGSEGDICVPVMSLALQCSLTYLERILLYIEMLKYDTVLW